MGDLQCAARVFVARHGEAVYESELLSDAGGWLSPLGRRQAKELAASLAPERISRVWASDMARAVQTAEIIAGVLDVDVVVRKGLREFGVGDAAGTTGDPDPFAATFAAWVAGDHTARIPGGESGEEVAQRVTAVLDEVADGHRGESVLVVSHGGVMSMVLAALAGNVHATHGFERPMPHCGVVALEADADGWVCRSWAGVPVG